MSRSSALSVMLLLACSGSGDDTGAMGFTVALDAQPDPGDWSLVGPGGPATSFTEAELFEPCAWLEGNELSDEHHNLVMMHDGYLLFPWAPEYGGGGISFFDVSDPCSPVKVGEVYEETMRETHTLSIGRVGEREYLAVDMHMGDKNGGIGFFDITDVTAPTWVGGFELPEYNYPDAYFRVALSTTWVGDRLYVPSGLNGVFILDVSDPADPELIGQIEEVGHIAGTFHVIGNTAISSSAGLARMVFYDIGDPDDIETLADIQVGDDDDPLDNFYFATIGGEYALLARKDDSGGPIVYDITDPENPVNAGSFSSVDGDGGYCFRHGDKLFQGESNFGALYDFPDPQSITELGRFELKGDVDTVTPIGNVAFVSVDEKGDPGLATGVYPWDVAPDADPPSVKHHDPADGEIWVPLSGGIGISLDELIEPRSVHAGSFRVWDETGAAVSGRLYVLEGLVNFVPDEPLSEDTTYWVEIPSGGIADNSGNPTSETAVFGFSTGAEVLPWPG